MKEKRVKNILTNRILLQKLKDEGKAKFNKIDKILLFTKQEIHSYSQRNYKIYKKDNKNHIYNETFKNIHKFNNILVSKINRYKEKRKEINDFINGYKTYHKYKKRIPMKEIEKKNLVFGHLLHSYEKKGLKIKNDFFNSDIYKESGLLFCKKDEINNYFNQEVHMESKEGQKSLIFLNKVSKEIGKIFKNKENSKEDYSKANTSLEIKNNGDNKAINKLSNKMEENDYFNKSKEIEKHEKEIKKIKQLISSEEKEYKLKHNRINSINKYSKKFIESYKYLPKNKNRITNISYEENKIENNFYSKNISKIDYNSYNSNNVSTSFPEKSIFTNNKKKVNKTFILSSLNNANKINSEKNIKEKLILDNFRNNSINAISSKRIGKISDNLDKIDLSRKSIERKYENFDESDLHRKRRRSTFKIISLNKPKIAPPIFINRLNNRRKSFVSISFFNSLNNSTNITINKYLNKRYSLRNNKNRPNSLNLSRPIKDIYDKISRINIYSYKNEKNKKMLNDLLKKFYGDKINNFNKKEIIKNYVELKDNIIVNERNNKIYAKYGEIFCNKMAKNIDISKEQNEKLKKNPINYIKILYGKNNLESVN